jgi:hypothetical protein
MISKLLMALGRTGVSPNANIFGEKVVLKQTEKGRVGLLLRQVTGCPHYDNREGLLCHSEMQVKPMNKSMFKKTKRGSEVHEHVGGGGKAARRSESVMADTFFIGPIFLQVDERDVNASPLSAFRYALAISDINHAHT